MAKGAERQLRGGSPQITRRSFLAACGIPYPPPTSNSMPAQEPTLTRKKAG